jgi:molybdate/tungstate transport system substrate-binding protein
MNRRIVLAITMITVLVIASIATVILLSGPKEKTILKIFTAGSLSEPFDAMENDEDLETIFEAAHPNVDVQITSGGSADMIRRITDLDQSCDVLAVADYSLIPSMMINTTTKTADWVIEFAKNSMVIAYTDLSRNHAEINASNWMDVLRKPDVKFGFSNPNDDPAGYRAQMVMILAQKYYSDTAIYKDLVMNNTNIQNVTTVNGTTTVKIPTSLTVTNTNKLMIRSAEVDLTSALESGSIDYLFIYESVAFRHQSSGQRFIELPMEVNLNETAFTVNYSKVKVTQFADNANASKIKTVKASPIVYGITIPKTAVSIDLAEEFVKMVITGEGRHVMLIAGQENIDPAYAGYWKPQVPAGLRDFVN